MNAYLLLCVVFAIQQQRSAGSKEPAAFLPFDENLKFQQKYVNFEIESTDRKVGISLSSHDNLLC